MRDIAYYAVGNVSQEVRLSEYVSRFNASIAVIAGACIAVLELILVIGALARISQSFSVEKFVSYLLLSLASVILSYGSYRYLRRGGSSRRYTYFIAGYLCLTAAYGIHNSLIGLAQGKQIITFLMVMNLATCVFVTPPVGVILFTAASYGCFFFLSLSAGPLDSGSTVNLWLSWVVCTVAGFLRYRESLQGARNENMLRSAGEHDGLTGLRNRSALRMDFSKALGQDQYVIMADLDDFKAVNDGYGHEAGDDVLRACGRALPGTFPFALIYRYGGDEFLLMVPADSVSNMDECARELRERIRLVQLSDGRTIEAGMSLGIVRGTAATSDELRELIRQADQALYEDKRLRKA